MGICKRRNREKIERVRKKNRKTRKEIKGGDKMTIKIFKSGEKGFEEEKAKMFEDYKEMTKPRNEAKKGLTKEEQLEKVFPTILSAMFLEYDMIQHGGMYETELKEKYTRILLREVKARVNLK